MSEMVRGSDLRVGDVIVNPHRGTMPPARITRVHPVEYLGGVSITYTPNGEDKYGSYIDGDRLIEVDRSTGDEHG